MIPLTVVVATRDRCDQLCRTLDRLAGLPERPRVIVVDNGSADGTSATVRARYPGVELVTLTANYGVFARNIGVARATTGYVAFSDDDSWWEPGALAAAAGALDRHPGLGLVAASTLVGPREDPDPLNEVLAASPLPRGDLPGPRVLGFLACASVVRRAAFTGVGGFSRMLQIGGEEKLLAGDLAAAGWPAAYLPGVIAHHWPSPVRDVTARRWLSARNEALTDWLRRPVRRAVRSTRSLARRAASDDPVAARALAGLLRLLPRALASRRAWPAEVEAQFLMLEAAGEG